MSNSINTNIAAFYAQENITTASTNTSKAVAQLSSGNAITEVSDNVAAFAVGTSIGSQVNALTSAQTNATQGSSLLQVAGGALQQIQTILQQQQSLANQAQSGSLTDTDREFLQEQFAQLTQEINALATGTTFNGVQLIDGSLASASALEAAGTGVKAASATIVGSTTTNIVTGFAIDGSSATAPTFNNDTTTTNDTLFTGALSGGTFQVTATTSTAAAYSVSYTIPQTVNGVTTSETFLGTLNTAGTTTNTTLVLDDGSANITFTLAGTGAPAITQAQVQTALTAVFASATAYSQHTVLATDATDASGNNIAGTAIQGTDNKNSVLGNLVATEFNGSDVTLSSSTQNSKYVPAISGFVASGSGAGSTLSVEINGQTYTTAAVVTTTDSAGKLASTQWGNGTEGIATFYLDGNTSSNSYLQINFSLATGSDGQGNILTTANADATTNALDAAFSNSGSAQGGVTFQLGSTSAANVTVTLGNATSSSLFGGASLNISSATGAGTAATAVTAALNTVTAQQAQVGAYESQFNFASAALQSSVQNETAAQSALLDTNFAVVSTQYATDQVQLQAGIAALAQANQEGQLYLKLLS